jgi:alkylhydroperoxidase family enzyme
VTTRINPLEPPYDPGTDKKLRAMMPPGVEPIALFRTFAKNPGMTDAMRAWGSYELSKHLSVGMREREIIIDRTTARCGCQYEWGVHIAFFAERVGLTPEQVTSLTHGDHRDPCWNTQRDMLLIRLADSLHDNCDVPDDLWTALAIEFNEAQLLDLTMLCGWYHTISFTARAARVPPETFAPTFDNVAVAIA